MKERSRKGPKILLGILIFLSSIGIVYTLVQIGIWLWDNHKLSEEMKKIALSATVTTIEEKAQEETVSFLEVNFSELEKINDEVVAWVSIPETNIDYPVVQHSDNDYYLDHSFNRSKNGAGWVFMDYHNKREEQDRNVVLYAHARKDGSMFGTLKNVLTSQWLENEENHIIKMSTKNENSLWQIFSVYRVPEVTDYIQTEFANDEQFQKFLDIIQQRSLYDFNTTLDGEDRVLTFSTCYNSKERLVVHAKLVNTMKK